MVEAVNKMNEITEELMDLVVSSLDRTQIIRMSEDEIRLYQMAFKLLEVSNEVMVKAAEMMEAQDRKLNMILEKLEEKES